MGNAMDVVLALGGGHGVAEAKEEHKELRSRRTMPWRGGAGARTGGGAMLQSMYVPLGICLLRKEHIALGHKGKPCSGGA